MPRLKGSKNRGPPKKTGPHMVSMYLTQAHSINDKGYGPGQTLVPANLAAFLAEQERNSQRAEEIFRSTRACIITWSRGGILVREVPPQEFDAQVGREG